MQLQASLIYQSERISNAAARVTHQSERLSKAAASIAYQSERLSNAAARVTYQSERLSNTAARVPYLSERLSSACGLAVWKQRLGVQLGEFFYPLLHRAVLRDQFVNLVHQRLVGGLAVHQRPLTTQNICAFQLYIFCTYTIYI